MLENIPKISVLVICYKQENVIRRAMDSLIAQKDYIYEICINDDKSPDKTWEILLEYQAKYPDLVKPVRNDPNLGIFQNIEATWKRPMGDMIYQLSGDDECGKDYFKHVVEFVLEKGIDYKNQAFCVYGDYVQINKNGQSIRYKNELIHPNVIKLKLRKLLSNRSACFSRKVLESFVPISEGRSYMIEAAQDIELQVFSKYNYYVPFIGNIYYAEIGVSASDQLKNERKQAIDVVFQKVLAFLRKNGIKSDKSDLNFVKYYMAYKQGKAFLAFYYYVKGIDFKLGKKGVQLERIAFVLKNKFSMLFHDK